jgi:hypothetical protein
MAASFSLSAKKSYPESIQNRQQPFIGLQNHNAIRQPRELGLNNVHTRSHKSIEEYCFSCPMCRVQSVYRPN